MINNMTRANQGLHYGGTGSAAQKNVFVTKSASGTTYADAVHTYGIEWSAEAIACELAGIAGGGWASAMHVCSHATHTPTTWNCTRPASTPDHAWILCLLGPWAQAAHAPGPRADAVSRSAVAMTPPPSAIKSLPALLNAVYVDGTLIQTLQPSSIASGGWYTTAAGAPATAPFDIPFFITV